MAMVTGIQTVLVAGIPATAVSMGATFSSDGVPVANRAFLGVQFTWSAGTSPVGTLAIQGSVDGANWESFALDGTGATTYAISGNTGTHIVDLGPTSVPLIRVVYTRTSGTATAAVSAFSKAF